MARFGLSAIILAAVLQALPASAAESWNLYTHQSAPQFTTNRGAARLADAIDKTTNGEIKVRRHLAGTLQINAANMVQAVSGNVVQMGDDLFFSGSIPVAAMLRLPFLIQSYEDLDKAQAVLMPYIEKAYADKGILVLAAYSYPNQYLWGRKKIGSLGDISGQKLRIASPEQGEFIRRFGGSSVTMGANEVPSALDRGVVDGLITGTVGADLWKDLLKSGYLMGLNFNNAYFIVNAAAFNKLSPELQAKVRAAAKEAAQWNTDTMKQEDGEIVTRLRAASMNITDATPADTEKAASTMKSYWEEWSSAQGPAMVEALGKVRAAVGR